MQRINIGPFRPRFRRVASGVLWILVIGMGLLADIGVDRLSCDRRREGPPVCSIERLAPILSRKQTFPPRSIVGAKATYRPSTKRNTGGTWRVVLVDRYGSESDFASFRDERKALALANTAQAFLDDAGAPHFEFQQESSPWEWLLPIGAILVGCLVIFGGLARSGHLLVEVDGARGVFRTQRHWFGIPVGHREEQKVDRVVGVVTEAGAIVDFLSTSRSLPAMGTRVVLVTDRGARPLTSSFFGGRWAQERGAEALRTALGLPTPLPPPSPSREPWFPS